MVLAAAARGLRPPRPVLALAGGTPGTGSVERGLFWGSCLEGRGMAANQARRSAPTRLKRRSREGMICRQWWRLVGQQRRLGRSASCVQP